MFEEAIAKSLAPFLEEGVQGAQQVAGAAMRAKGDTTPGLAAGSVNISAPRKVKE